MKKIFVIFMLISGMCFAQDVYTFNYTSWDEIIEAPHFDIGLITRTDISIVKIEHNASNFDDYSNMTLSSFNIYLIYNGKEYFYKLENIRGEIEFALSKLIYFINNLIIE